ncbi:hypothetical protein H0Z60_08850 [Ectothiorhodospiraceae bacterium WFHF3C12]|nr:hypothetical protein [Ectothiorhodospiraceae bacterium WFHF3C12]
MTGHALLTIWSDSVILSGLIWLVIALVLLYLARRPAHAALLAAGRALHRGLRLSAQSVMRLESRLAERNRQVLRAQAVSQQERLMEKEFRRVGDAVAQDLAHYPALHRGLSEQITRIDEDYRRSTEVPPPPPAWLEAVDAVANIPAKDDPAVNKILEDIHATLERSCHNTVMEYRAASHRRHRLLRRMLPYWRRLRETLDRVDRNIAAIEQRSRRIDEHMHHYERLRAEADVATRSLQTSALSRFLLSAALLGVAGLAGFMDYTLIARPMAELTGGLGGLGPTGLAGFDLAQVAAGTLVLVHIFLGLFLMELLGVTKLLPLIGAWQERRRRALAVLVGVLLVVSALLVAGLAFQRDYLLSRDMAITAFAIADPAQPPQVALRWTPALAQMFMGLLAPFVLVLAAIPLESFLHSGRSVIGSLGTGLLRLCAYVLRLLGQVSEGLAVLLIRVYDLLIFLPLAVEGWVRSALQPRESAVTRDAPAIAEKPAKSATRASSPARGRRRKAAAGEETASDGDGSDEQSSGTPEAQT